MASERCAAILAMRQVSMLMFLSTGRTPARSSFDRGNRRVTQDNFCRFVGHFVEEITKTRSKRLLWKALFLDDVETLRLQRGNENIHCDNCQFVGDFHL